jgi:hypothetical protein
MTATCCTDWMEKNNCIFVSLMSVTNFQVFSETTETIDLAEWVFENTHILRNALHMFLTHLPLCVPNLALQELDTIQRAYWTIYENALLPKQYVTIYPISSEFELERSWIRFKTIEFMNLSWFEIQDGNEPLLSNYSSSLSLSLSCGQCTFLRQKGSDVF